MPPRACCWASVLSVVPLADLSGFHGLSLPGKSPGTFYLLGIVRKEPVKEQGRDAVKKGGAYVRSKSSQFRVHQTLGGDGRLVSLGPGVT